MVGILAAGGATGQLIFLPLLASTIVAVGWRPAVLLVAAVALLVIPPVVLIVRSFPQDVGLSAYGAPTPDLVIAHTNLYWQGQRAPGRRAGAVETAEVSFASE